MPKKKPFIFNDEAVDNSYGFRIPTKGIGLKRFKKNPVMLDSHLNSTKHVLGHWENVKVEKGLLTGEPVFDSADENVTLIEGKVERGVIKSCSMGISFNREDLKLVAGVLLLTKCELYEVSIVAVPSNANSIRLYLDGSDTALTDTEVQTLCMSLADSTEVSPIEKHTENENMKITLTLAAATALGFGATELEQDVADVNAKIQKLSAEKQAAELKLEVMESDAAVAAKASIEAEVELAFKQGQITADKKEKFVQLGLVDRSLMTETLSAIPVKKSIAQQIETPSSDGEVKSMDDFQKLTLSAQLEFKANQPEAYNKIITLK